MINNNDGLSIEDLDAILDLTGAPENTINRNYSGRSMYGATCFAVEGTLEDFAMFMGAAGIVLSEERDHEPANVGRVLDLAQSVRMDRLGHDYVFYFVGWQIEERDEDPPEAFVDPTSPDGIDHVALERDRALEDAHTQHWAATFRDGDEDARREAWETSA
jgi:hypothetical protein